MSDNVHCYCFGDSGVFQEAGCGMPKGMEGNRALPPFYESPRPVFPSSLGSASPNDVKLKPFVAIMLLLFRVFRGYLLRFYSPRLYFILKSLILKIVDYQLIKCGARGGSRTLTSFRTADFKSAASTIPPPGLDALI